MSGPVVTVLCGEQTGDARPLLATFPSAVAAVERALELVGDGTLTAAGLDAGEEGPGDTAATVAGRLSEIAEPGQVLATDVVRQIASPHLDVEFQPLGTTKLSGVDRRVAVFSVAREQPAARPEPARTISVVVADDQQLVRAGFRVILDDEPDLRVVGEAADGRTAVDVVLRRRPGVVLMDIRMPELDGLRAAERIVAEPGLDTAVLMLTTFDVREYVYEALRIGASGFLLKDAPADQLVDAVRVVAAGDALLAPSITRRLIGEFARGPSRPAGDSPPPELSELTSRELDVLRLVGRGLSNAEIASELVLGENTVKTHVANVRGKLDLRDRVQAVVLAHETGLVGAGE